MKRWISLLLVLLLLLPMGAGASAQEAGGIQKGDIVYLGRWNDAPIRWLVLDPAATNAGGEGLFLLSEQTLTNQGVVYSWSRAVWQGSEGQLWCSDLLGSSFTAAEQGAIPAVSKSEEGFQQYGLNWGPVALENEQVFFISAKELGDYIGPNDGDPGISASFVGDGKTAYYWLRTPHGSHNDYAGLVIESDQVHDFLVYGSWAARPATNLGGEGLLYLAANERVIGPCELGGMPGADNGEWKATVLDDAIGLTLEDVSYADGQLSVRCSGAPEDAWISVLVRDAEGHNVLYGCLGKAGSAQEFRFTPQLPEGGSLWLFAEVDKGPGSSNTASALCPLSWEETPAPTPEPEPAAEEAAAAEEQSAPAAEETPAPAVPAPQSASFRRTLWMFGILFGAFSVAAVVVAVRQARRNRRYDDEDDWE